ncbi:MAG TPA: hypothetical protein VFE08_14520 [Candidatus Sulfotelmatobacter sp.]|jgi:hypothetical protein|nr:hypothetical protein [Candidatus Sulfotelmatobacter sp.]
MHDIYPPVGYAYRADQYCLDCIPTVLFNRYGSDGYGINLCNCCECRLDRIAETAGIADRMDESSYDMDTFPKSIPYFNEVHIECGPTYYGYGPDDPEWLQQYCGATCAKCHCVIDGTEYHDGEEKCPVWIQRKDNGFSE